MKVLMTPPAQSHGSNFTRQECPIIAIKTVLSFHNLNQTEQLFISCSFTKAKSCTLPHLMFMYVLLTEHEWGGLKV